MIRPDAWWRDYTGRFQHRPYYHDASIEAAAQQFLRETLSENVEWPISDNDLEFAADMKASFDRGRDVNSLGLDVDAITIFNPGGRPRIVMNKLLKSSNMRLRRRMTIAHELGHVVLHQPLYTQEGRQLDLLQEYRKTPAYCHDAMSKASADWCEWQASYFGGALLAPKAMLIDLVRGQLGATKTVPDGDIHARRLIQTTATRFEISSDAARVRLAQIGVIVPINDLQLPSQTA